MRSGNKAVLVGVIGLVSTKGKPSNASIEIKN